MEPVTLGRLKFVFKAKDTVVQESTQELNSLIPGDKPCIEHFFSVQNGDKQFYIFYWLGSFTRELGPMSIVKSWPISIIGLQTQIIEAENFMNSLRKAYSVYFQLSDTESYMIYTTDCSLEEFKCFLKTLQTPKV